MQSESLTPDRTILSNVIRQGEKVRVGEKGSGFMLVIERTSISHRTSRACAPLGPYPFGTAEKRRVVLFSANVGSVNFRSIPPDFCWTVPEYSQGGRWCKEQGCLRQYDYVR